MIEASRSMSMLGKGRFRFHCRVPQAQQPRGLEYALPLTFEFTIVYSKCRLGFGTRI